MKTQAKKKILCLFDYDCHSGFANVSHNLLDQLDLHYKGEVEFVIVAINYHGKGYKKGTRTVLSAKEASPAKRIYGEDAFLNILATDNTIDAFFIMQDLQVIKGMQRSLEAVKRKRMTDGFPVIGMFYFPVDSELFPEWCKGWEFMDSMITYTNYGKEQFAKHSNQKVEVIPHGCNFKDYFKMPSTKQRKLRQELFPNNDFVLVTVNRNQVRKDYPSLLIGWAEALKKVESKNPLLYIHALEKDDAGYDLGAIIKTLNIPRETIQFCDYNGNGTPYTRAQLNEIYNAADGFITTTTGEGWGLTVTEAISVGLPVILPLHTSFTDIIGDETMFEIDTYKRIFGKDDYYRLRDVCDSSDVAENILHLSRCADLYWVADNINSPVLEEFKKETNRLQERIKQFDWLLIGEKWATFIAPMIGL